MPTCPVPPIPFRPIAQPDGIPAPPRRAARPARDVRWLAGLALLSAGASPIAVAQGTVGPSGGVPGVATVMGLVVDSLHGGPVVGAKIGVEGSARTAVTDSAGRFRLDTLRAGRFRLDVFHPVLDSLGLTLVSPFVSTAAGDTVRVVLAVPSAATLVALICQTRPSGREGKAGPSLLVGRVLDAETEHPVPGARVALSWTDIDVNRESGLKHIDRARDTAAGPTGLFHFCWLPAGVDGTLHAARTVRSEIIDRRFVMRNRYIALVALHVPGVASDAPTAVTNAAASGSPESATSAAQVAQVAQVAHAQLTGRVSRPDGAPVAGALVQVAGDGDSAVTTDSGRFVLRRLPTGSRTLVVRAVGYEPVSVPVELSAHEARQIAVTVGVKTVVLKAILVTAQLNAGYQRVGFDRRKAAGIGRFLTAEDIERRRPFEVRDVLVGMPGLMTASTRSGRLYTVPSPRNRCLLYVVDNQVFRELSPGDVDTFVRPQEMAGVEVYQTGEAPGELVTGPGAAACAVVVIWTKTRLGVH